MGKVVLVLVLVGATACMNAKMEVELPDSPDMDPLVDEYDFPEAPFSIDILNDLLADAMDVKNLMASLGLISSPETGEDDPVSIALGALTALASGSGDGTETEGQALVVEGGLETQGQSITVAGQEYEGDGYIEVTRVCPGWDDELSPNPDKNGTISLTAIFHDTGFEAVVWGEADKCRYRFDNVHVLRDGEGYVHTGGALPTYDGEQFTKGEAEELLIRFVGDATLGKDTFHGDYDFRVLVTNSSLEISLDTPDGNVVYYAISETEQGFIASDGTWICNIGAKTCEKK